MINIVHWRGFRITYISDYKSDVLHDFKILFEDLMDRNIYHWKLVGHHEPPETAGPEKTWIIPHSTQHTAHSTQHTAHSTYSIDANCVDYLFKQAIKTKKWKIDRALRGIRARGEFLIKRIENARELGFNTPMRILLFAERYDFGVVKERYVMAEVIDGVPLHKIWRDKKEKILKTVLQMHKFGLGWGGDPNMGNFLLTPSGEIRAIDLGFNRLSWMSRGKDLYCLDWLYGIRDGKFRLNVIAAWLQSWFKKTGPYGKNGALALSARLAEDAELGIFNEK